MAEVWLACSIKDCKWRRSVSIPKDQPIVADYTIARTAFCDHLLNCHGITIPTSKWRSQAR
jgi:hypothetical protein